MCVRLFLSISSYTYLYRLNGALGTESGSFYLAVSSLLLPFMLS